ncbi:MAG: 50S ribosomal protein L17 [Candidatus Omnitrophica bacterium]|nr:50S ribosomal protein L17 [Candidatus Omnitrophota bacterium]
MPHAVQTRHFGRNTPWRKATVRSLAQALLTRERIITTRAKAKETQRLADRLITLGKDGSLSARRRAISILNDVELVGRLFAEIAPRFSARPGGYTRVLHAGHRSGDAAAMAVLELVELAPEKKTKPKGKEKEKPVKGTAPAAPAKKEEPKREEPKRPKREEAPKPEAAHPAEPQPKKAPGGFIEGLRGFFKRRDNPK